MSLILQMLSYIFIHFGSRCPICQHSAASPTSSLNSRIGQLSLSALASINLFDINTADANTLGTLHLRYNITHINTYAKIHTLLEKIHTVFRGSGRTKGVSVQLPETCFLIVFLSLCQEIVDKDGQSKVLSFTVPSLSKPSVYHEVRHANLSICWRRNVQLENLIIIVFTPSHQPSAPLPLLRGL